VEDAEQGVANLLLARLAVDLVAREVSYIENVHRLLAIGADMGRADGEIEIGDLAGELMKKARAVEAGNLDDRELLRERV
jgi:hypothetical protein